MFGGWDTASYGPSLGWKLTNKVLILFLMNTDITKVILIMWLLEFAISLQQV